MAAILGSAALLLGLAASTVRLLDPLALGLAAAGSALAALLARPLPGARAMALLSLMGALGALRVALWPPPAYDGLTAYHGQRLPVLGRVASPALVRGDRVTFLLDASEVAVEPGSWRTAAGRVEVTARSTEVTRRLETGDWVVAEGRLVAPTSPAGYPRAELLRRRGVFSVLSFPSVRFLERPPPDAFALAGRVRAAVAGGFERLLPQPHASLATGLLLGGSATFDPRFRQQVQAAGLGHLVAASGYNIVLVAGLLQVVSGRVLGRRLSLVPVLLGIAAYTLVAGAPPSAVRAALMVGAAVVAAAVGRLPDALTALMLAAAGMALVQPPVLLDVGFLLSVSATLGLILLYPCLRRSMSSVPRPLAEPLALALAAGLATLPVTLAVFQQVSVVSPLANLLATPLVPAIMATSAALAAALPLGPVADLLAGMVWLPTTALVALARTLGSLPGASVFSGEFPPAAAFALAALLLGWGLAALPEARPIREGAARLLEVLAVSRWIALPTAAAASVAVILLLARPDGRAHVSLLAVGPGQAYFIRAPDGATLLVAAGEADPLGLARLVGGRLNAWERGLDVVVLLGPRDEAAVREALRRYPARRQVTVDAGREARLETGSGLVLDVSGGGEGEAPSASVSYGQVWVQLAGTPPLPDGERLIALAGGADRTDAGAQVYLAVVDRSTRAPGPAVVLSVPAPREGVLELISDGQAVWPAASESPAGAESESGPTSAPTTSGSRPVVPA